MKSIEKIWDELFEYWVQHEPSFIEPIGATDEEIKELEKEMGMSLPTSLKESLKRCNSYPSDWEKVKKSSALLLGEAGQLYSVQQIIEWYKENMSYKVDYPFKSIYGDTRSPNSNWDEHWIPLYDYNADVFFAIDMRKENGVLCEKVLYIDFEYSILAVVADSYEEFLNQVLLAILEEGQYESKNLENVLLRYGVKQ